MRKTKTEPCTPHCAPGLPHAVACDYCGAESVETRCQVCGYWHLLCLECGKDVRTRGSRAVRAAAKRRFELGHVILSNNQLSQMEGCIRAMAFRTRARLRREEAGMPMHIGAGVHAGLAAMYSGFSTAESVERALANLEAGVEKDVLTYEEAKANEMRAEVERLVRFYGDARLGPDGEDALVPLAVENHFKVQVSENTQLVGVIDFYGDSVRGPAIMDHKTSRYGGARYFSKQELDGQLNLYAFAARELGLQPRAIGLNILVKTKAPRIERHWVPVNWDRVDEFRRRLEALGKFLGRLPHGPRDILRLPGNPGLCRHCPFAPLCEYPDQLAEIVHMDYQVANYDIFDSDD